MGITGFNAAFVPVVGSQSVVPLQAASASPGKILQMQIFNTTPRQKSETLGMGSAACFNKHSRWTGKPGVRPSLRTTAFYNNLSSRNKKLNCGRTYWKVIYFKPILLEPI